MTATAVIKMQRAGLTQERVEAIAEFVASELDLSKLATKADLAEVRAALEIKIAESKADLVKWVVGVGLAQAMALVGAVFAIVRFLPGGHP